MTENDSNSDLSADRVLVEPSDADALGTAEPAVDGSEQLSGESAPHAASDREPARAEGSTMPSAPQGRGMGAESAVGSPGEPAPCWFRSRATPARELRLIDRRLAKTLTLQGVVVLAVLGYWVLGKASWNHDPLSSQKYRPAEVSVLSNRPLNAALEFHHDLVTGQFGQARLLATEDAESLVVEAEQRCKDAAEHDACDPTAKVFTRSTLLRSLGQDATARVESFTADDVLVREGTYHLSRATGQWLVTGRAP